MPRVGVLSKSTGVLVDEGKRVVVAAGVQPSAQLDPLACICNGELVVDELLREGRIHGPNIGLGVDVVGTDPNAAGLGKGQFQFKLANAQTQQVLWAVSGSGRH